MDECFNQGQTTDLDIGKRFKAGTNFPAHTIFINTLKPILIPGGRLPGGPARGTCDSLQRKQMVTQRGASPVHEVEGEASVPIFNIT